MRALILGASGQTGYRLVQQLLTNQGTTSDQNLNVRVVVRSEESFHQKVPVHSRLEVFEGSILDIPEKDWEESVMEGCDVIVSCLGHNLTFQGMFGHPRKLVTDTLRRVHGTIQKKKKKKNENSTSIDKELPPTKLILMSSDGVENPNGSDDLRPLGERIVLAIIRTLLPPHRDNEEAAAYLVHQIGGNGVVALEHKAHSESIPDTEWVAVRPIDLIDGEECDYDTFNKPQGSLFGYGEVTRTNVAHFMYDLITNQELWDKWVYQMPVLINTAKK